jgi:hypothetical protein
VFYKEFAPIAIAYLVFGCVFWVCAAVRRWNVRDGMWKRLESERYDEEVMFDSAPTRRPFRGRTDDARRVAIKEAMAEKQDEEESAYGRVVIPASISNESLPDDYFQWRATLSHPPLPPVLQLMFSLLTPRFLRRAARWLS